MRSLFCKMVNFIENEEFGEKLNQIVDEGMKDEGRVRELVSNKNISERFGRYLSNIANLNAYMQMAKLCEEYGACDGQMTALQHAELSLERALSVYLSDDSRYGWTPDKMIAYMNGKFSQDYKELIEWAMSLKPGSEGERMFGVIYERELGERK